MTETTIRRVWEDLTVDVTARKVLCKHQIRQNEYNSVQCSRLNQWVSANLCVQCDHKEAVKQEAFLQESPNFLRNICLNVGERLKSHAKK